MPAEIFVKTVKASGGGGGGGLGGGGGGAGPVGLRVGGGQ